MEKELERKAKYNRHSYLTEKSFCFKTFQKRWCELNDEEKKEFNRLQKSMQREKQRRILNGRENQEVK